MAVVNLEALVFDRLEPVTVRWFAVQTQTSVAEARSQLQAFVADHPRGIAVVYVVSGDLIHGPSKAVKLVQAEALEDVSQQFVNPVVHLYGIAPAEQLRRVRAKDAYLMTTNV
mmetsp:Transcript_107260/g.185050  ORF Transcript_107260/g.185050 Transcript_107260/m.185050 type:complete len:113 (-) Transcript_107260:638-976(-)